MRSFWAVTATAFLLLCAPRVAHAQSAEQPVPAKISLDGVLIGTDGAPRTGNVLLVVSLYAAQADTASLWSEQQLITLDSAGRYSIVAGATLADGIPAEVFTSGAARWVAVGVHGEPELPKAMLVSIPYAMKAREADNLAGKPATDYVLSETLTETVRTVIREEGESGGGPGTLATTNFVPKWDSDLAFTESSITETGTALDPRVGIGTFGGAQSANLEVKASNAMFSLHDAVTGTQFQFINSGRGLFINRVDNGQFVATRLQMSNDANNVIGFNTANTTAQLNSVANSAGLSALYLQSLANATAPTAAFVAGPGQVAPLAQWTARDSSVSVVDALGNLGLGTASPNARLHVAGNATVDGNIGAKYQDVAEWVETPEPLESGTVVIVDPTTPNRVIAATTAYDTRIAGAVSAQPGLILGERGDGKEMVAQSGRVRIKVDAKYGAIKIGDLLVTSPTPGHAMKSKAMRIGGQALHRPGTLLGKALEALPKGKGEILVLLTLQ
jgi:hypothetical protein